MGKCWVGDGPSSTLLKGLAGKRSKVYKGLFVKGEELKGTKVAFDRRFPSPNELRWFLLPPFEPSEPDLEG